MVLTHAGRLTACPFQLSDTIKTARLADSVIIQPYPGIADSIKASKKEVKLNVPDSAAITGVKNEVKGLNGADTVISNRLKGAEKNQLDHIKAQAEALNPENKLLQHGQSLENESKNLSKSVTGLAIADTAIKGKVSGATHQQINSFKTKLNGVNPSNGILKDGNAMEGQVKNLYSSFASKLPSLKQPPIIYNLTLLNDDVYQPRQMATTPAPAFGIQQQAVSFGAIGNVQLWGIPFNVNYTSSRAGNSGLSGFNNNLFRFNFDANALSNNLRNEWQQYDELRKNVFGGLDLTDYTRKMLTDQLNTNEQQLKATASQQQLAGILNNPQKINELLSLDPEQMRQQLTAELSGKEAQLNPKGLASPVVKDKLMSGSGTVTPFQNAFGSISGSASFNQYLSSPGTLKKLSKLSEDKVSAALSKQLDHNPELIDTNKLLVVAAQVNNVLLIKYINREIQQQQQAKEVIIKDMAAKIAASGKQGKPLQFNNLMQQQQQSVTSMPIAGNANVAGINGQVETMTQTLTAIKSQLKQNGMDVNRLLQMQQLMNTNRVGLGNSELAGSLLTKRPGNAVQDILSKFSAIKLGSFGTNVPGSIQSQDLFMSGTSVTYKAGLVPLTFGYGSVNDLAAAKDDGMQSSIYNAPRNITYIGAELRRGGYGIVKVSVIGSTSHQADNSLYALPAVSSNNVAVTISKTLNMGRVGSLGVDVSKSTTVYSNNYQIGSEAIFNKKGGLDYNSQGDLFEAMSFGLDHHLDITSANMTDDIYFNYTGMGYQNPGNTGYSGARTKLGGSLKKAFYKNKLTLTLHTDLSNMPISYTSNDRWKNYQVQLNSRYVISKKFNINLQYTQNGTDKQIDNIITPVYGFKKLQFDGNTSYKIGNNFTVSHLSIGGQNFSNTDVTQASSNILTMNYTQSMVLRKNTLTATIFYNKELSDYQLIGDMLNSDISYQYILFNKVSLTSGFTYLANTGIARQIGVKQGIQLFANDRFDIDSYVDLRKNMITPLYSDLYASCRAELTLKYHLKN